MNTSIRSFRVEEWEEILMPSEYEALEDNGLTQNKDWALSADEVFETIVKWNGGMATAYHIKSCISRVYGIEL